MDAFRLASEQEFLLIVLHEPCALFHRHNFRFTAELLTAAPTREHETGARTLNPGAGFCIDAVDREGRRVVP
jgi:hypothetical protein